MRLLSLKSLQVDAENYVTVVGEKNDNLYLVKASAFRKLFRTRKTLLIILTRKLKNWSGA